MNKILVTGGCGYIGSHTIVDLVSSNFDAVSVDNLSNSDESCLDAIHKITGKKVRNYKVDLCDGKALRKVLENESKIDGIIHFAALKSVPESVEHPVKYFKNNIESLINTLDCALQFDISNVIYSSSCTVYGAATDLPVTEDSPILEAQAPYGRSKQIGEMILEDCAKSGLKGISLRYFNPAGAHPTALMGESPSNPALNLVPIITETAIGKRAKMTVYGDDYLTRDGSCIRDYIHIMDLAKAHRLAMAHLFQLKSQTYYDVFNLGSGTGVSVFEAIQAFEKVTGLSLNYQIGKRRSGDVPAIYANYSKSQEVLGWQPTHSLEEMMQSAWEWEKYRTLKNSYSH